MKEKFGLIGTILTVAACNGSFSFDTPLPSDGSVADAGAILDGDASTDATLSDGGDAGPPDAESDSPTSIADPGTDCATAGPCPPGGHFCCSSTSGYSCMTEGSYCGGLAVPCDDSVACPGTALCCAEGSSTMIVEVECTAKCFGTILCDPTRTVCPSGLTCLPLDAGGLPPGYMGCQ